jgi:hypothetical protein
MKGSLLKILIALLFVIPYAIADGKRKNKKLL